MPFFIFLHTVFPIGWSIKERLVCDVKCRFVLKVENYWHFYQNNFKRLKVYKNNVIIKAINEFS